MILKVYHRHSLKITKTSCHWLRGTTKRFAGVHKVKIHHSYCEFSHIPREVVKLKFKFAW